MKQLTKQLALEFAQNNTYNIKELIAKTSVLCKEIMQSYEDNGNADDLPDDIPEKLLFYYHQKIKNWTKIYERDYESFKY